MSLIFQNAAEEKYKELQNCSVENYKHFFDKHNDSVLFIEKTELFLCRINCILAVIPPIDLCDKEIRNLWADAFDSFLASKKLILEGFLNQPFPVLRRAFETMLLIRYFIHDPSRVEKWSKGGKKGEIRPEETRKVPNGDTEFINKLYDYYCKGTHVNSMYIWQRQLGEGNSFTLGNIQVSANFAITREYLHRHVQLLALFRYIVYSYYQPIIEKLDPDINIALDEISDEKADIIIEELHEALEQIKDEMARIQGIERGPSSHPNK
jgi:hypothetical protein